MADGPLVVLGAGYAGLTVAQQVGQRPRSALPTVLVDRHPVHVLRTELYEVGRLALEAGESDWTVPLGKVLERSSVAYREGSVTAIDLAHRTVRLDSGTVEFGTLAICLGSVAAYYRVPGAAEQTFQVYRLSKARELAARLREVELASADLPGERRPRVAVVGGGSTGTEVAAEIASTDWSQVVGRPARPPDVYLLTGSLPFLAGLPPPLVEHARALLRRAGVSVVYGLNVTRVEPGRIHLEDGTVLACDVVVWCAGVEAPKLIAELPVPHGHGGRLAVEPTLELPGQPGVFAVGDVAELKDPRTGVLVPATAQAAVAEARTAARNIVARRLGTPLTPFTYRERGVVVAVGQGRAAGAVRRLSLWSQPASLLKRVVERQYARRVAKGESSPLV
jgi:NADH:ubiquinone reductase (H+-translocating)